MPFQVRQREVPTYMLFDVFLFVFDTHKHFYSIIYHYFNTNLRMTWWVSGRWKMSLLPVS